MIYASLNDQRVMSGSVSIPWYGAPVADVVLADDLSFASTVASLVVADLTLAMSIVRAASFAGSRSARLVGGMGGWIGQCQSRAYDNPSGVLAQTVLGDLAAEVGETVAVTGVGPLGTSWVRAAGQACTALALVAGSLWWIDPTGVTQVGTPRSSLPIASVFTVIGYSGGTGLYTIATESLADWAPGRTFVAPTVDGVRTVQYVRHQINRDGIVRTEVLAR